MEVVELELACLKELEQKICDTIDEFYHFAWDGIRGHDRENQLLQKKNYGSTMLALQVAKYLGATVFVGVGSQAEYGTVMRNVREEDRGNPETAYGQYKLKSCIAGARYACNNHIRFIWGRVFSAYGRYDAPNSLLSNCIEKMLQNKSIELTMCRQKWNYIYVDDVAEALIRLAEEQYASGVYNIASLDTRPLREYVVELRDILSSKSNLEFGIVPYGDHGQVGFEPCIEKLQDTLHWTPMTSFADGIRKMLKDGDKR